MKYCPCGIYRQLNSLLQPSYHISKSSKIIFNGSVVKNVHTFAQNENKTKYSSVRHSHKLINVCLCGIYRQLNLIL